MQFVGCVPVFKWSKSVYSWNLNDTIVLTAANLTFTYRITNQNGDLLVDTFNPIIVNGSSIITIPVAAINISITSFLTFKQGYTCPDF